MSIHESVSRSTKLDGNYATKFAFDIRGSDLSGLQSPFFNARDELSAHALYTRIFLSVTGFNAPR